MKSFGIARHARFLLVLGVAAAAVVVLGLDNTDTHQYCWLGRASNMEQSLYLFLNMAYLCRCEGEQSRENEFIYSPT